MVQNPVLCLGFFKIYIHQFWTTLINKNNFHEFILKQINTILAVICKLFCTHTLMKGCNAIILFYFLHPEYSTGSLNVTDPVMYIYLSITGVWTISSKLAFLVFVFFYFYRYDSCVSSQSHSSAFRDSFCIS